MPTIYPATMPTPAGVPSPFTRLRIARGPEASPRDAWVCHLERGLCLQYYEDQVLAKTEAYGITHHEGYRLTGPWFRYEEARALQQVLLSLEIDWTQGREALDRPSPGRDQAQKWISYWRQIHGAFVDEAAVTP